MRSAIRNRDVSDLAISIVSPLEARDFVPSGCAPVASGVFLARLFHAANLMLSILTVQAKRRADVYPLPPTVKPVAPSTPRLVS